MPVRERSVRRPVVILLFTSLSLFAIPGDVFGTSCRVVGGLLLVAALFVSLKDNAGEKPFLFIGIGVGTGLAAFSLMTVLL